MPTLIPSFFSSHKFTIHLAEDTVILRGSALDNSNFILRGEVELLLSKPMNISSVEIKLVGKSFTLWPEGLGSGRNTKFSHEKKIHEQNLILQNWQPNNNNNTISSLSASSSRCSSTSSLQSTLQNNNQSTESYLLTNTNTTNTTTITNKNNNKKNHSITLPSGLHRWPFEFILSNKLSETIESETGKVFYYLVGKIYNGNSSQSNGQHNHHPNNPLQKMTHQHLRCRRNILILRTPVWSDTAIISNSLPTTSIVSDRHFPACDVNLCIEKSMASSGTLFPIHIQLAPNQKNVFLESISAIITESRMYRLPEFGEKSIRSELFDFKLKLLSITNLSLNEDEDNDQQQRHFILNRDDQQQHQKKNSTYFLLKRALFARNAHLPLTGDPFHYQLNFNLPNCIDINHSTNFHEIDIRHYLKLTVLLSTPNGPLTIPLETRITVLDCRLKEDYAILPTYEAAISSHQNNKDDGIVSMDDVDRIQNGFFICPCYMEYKKRRVTSSKNEWMKIRNNSNNNNNRMDQEASTSSSSLPQPPSYNDTILKYGPYTK
ncbi:unnamed protein product [Cunninghamella blakesleeana]